MSNIESPNKELKGNSDELRELGVADQYENVNDGSNALKKGIIAWEIENPNKRSVIIIAGPTGSGKGKLIEKLDFSGEDTTRLSLDRYYLGKEELEKRDGKANFSLFNALDENRISVDIAKIMSAKEGGMVTVPIYRMQESKRIGEEEIVIRRRLLIEGVYALQQALVDTPFRIYMDATENVLLERKLSRDLKERGIPEEVVKQRFEQNVIPAIQEFVVNQKELATVIIHNDESLEE